MILHRREILGVVGGLVLGGVGTWAFQRFLMPPLERPSGSNPPASGAIDGRYDPDEVLERLRAGNRRFVEGRTQYRGGMQVPIYAVPRDYRPCAVILGCSDTRVGSEIIFDEPVSELFDVRLAAHLLDAGARLSIEYAVSFLRVPLIVVLGHDSCTSLAAALGIGVPEAQIPAPVERLREELNSVIKEVQASGGDPMENAVPANIRHTVRQLQASVTLRENRRLRIVGAHWRLPSGEVQFLEKF